MKEAIHPKVKKTTISCVCGAEFEMITAKEGMKTEICSACHPFYTGKTKRVAVGGRVEKFNKKYGIEQKEQA